MKIDLIVSWPYHLDYPLWRQWLHDYRDKFEKAIVVFTNMNFGTDLRPFLQQELNKDGVTSFASDDVTGKDDWRNIAVNNGLRVSDAEWVMFMEEDFFPHEGFWDVVENLSKQGDVFGFFQDTRLHPCCIFIKRALLNRTSRNFGVVQDKSDHFGLLQKELEEKQIPIGIIAPMYGQHLNGLSQNMYLLMLGEEPNYDPPEFKEYCKMCLRTHMNIQPDIKELLESYIGYN